MFEFFISHNSCVRICISFFTSAVCLDGTLPGYHLHRGYGSGANSWLVQLEVCSKNNTKENTFLNYLSINFQLDVLYVWVCVYMLLFLSVFRVLPNIQTKFTYPRTVNQQLIVSMRVSNTLSIFQFELDINLQLFTFWRFRKRS